MPEDEAVSGKAIAEGLELVLSKQDANGGWDDEEIVFGPGKDPALLAYRAPVPPMPSS